jgi:competence protein ComEC
MVEALVLARREHLDPDLREAFALSGTAHLLAISGFHVGVFAGLLLGLLRLLSVLPQRALPMAAVGSWIYVLSIGAPDAAARAALLFTLLAMARLRGVPPMSVGTLASALLVLLLMNPGALVSVGFQLSFAGTWGILVLRKPVSGLLRRGWGKGGGAPDGSPLSWLKDGTDGLAAGISATLPTLPLLAWHFDRISLVGIPATLLAAPLVSLAIPGIATTLVLSVVAPVPATFLAGGVVLLLDLLRTMVMWAAELPGASLWVSRGGLLLFLGGGGGVLLLLRQLGVGRIRAQARWGVSTLVGFAALLLRPLLPGPERMELHLLDVGQGDAVALRLPDTRWVLVDAGPAGAGFDAGARRVVPHLRREGVRRVDLLVLSHAHLDHLGGAPAVLRNLEVGGVLEPARLHPSRAYRETLELGRTREIPWWPAQAGTSVLWGEVRFSVLHPDPAHPEREANEDSVILLVEWGEIAILLTGDAYGAQEVALLPELPRLTVLKAGHHGSRTSTSQPLLDRTRPELTLLSLGDGNRYGHPHAEVMDRLQASGTRVIRTDWDGSTVIRLTRGGRWSLR